MRLGVAGLFCLAVAAALSTNAATVSKDPGQAPNGTYVIDTAHSQVLFSILHLGLTDYFGRFDRISGSLNYDGNQPERSSLAITIDTTSIDTPIDRITDALKSIFRTLQYPTATFKSTTIARTGPDTGEITGMLTIKDVTKPVTLSVRFNGSERSLLIGGYALGFQASTIIRRSDFGLDNAIWSAFVGDDVRLTIEAMFDQNAA